MISVLDIKELVPEGVELAIYGRLDRPEILIQAAWSFENDETKDGVEHKFGVEQLVKPREGAVLHAVAEIVRKYKSTFAEFYEEEFGDA